MNTAARIDRLSSNMLQNTERKPRSTEEVGKDGRQEEAVKKKSVVLEANYLKSICLHVLHLVYRATSWANFYNFYTTEIAITVWFFSFL